MSGTASMRLADLGKGGMAQAASGHAAGGGAAAALEQARLSKMWASGRKDSMLSLVLMSPTCAWSMKECWAATQEMTDSCVMSTP